MNEIYFDSTKFKRFYYVSLCFSLGTQKEKKYILFSDKTESGELTTHDWLEMSVGECIKSADWFSEFFKLASSGIVMLPNKTA